MKCLMVNVLVCDTKADEEDLKKGKTKYRFDYQISKKIKLRDGTIFESNEKASAKSLVPLKSGPQILEIEDGVIKSTGMYYFTVVATHQSLQPKAK